MKNAIDELKEINNQLANEGQCVRYANKINDIINDIEKSIKNIENILDKIISRIKD